MPQFRFNAGTSHASKEEPGTHSASGTTTGIGASSFCLCVTNQFLGQLVQHGCLAGARRSKDQQAVVFPEDFDDGQVRIEIAVYPALFNCFEFDPTGVRARVTVNFAFCSRKAEIDSGDTVQRGLQKLAHVVANAV